MCLPQDCLLPLTPSLPQRTAFTDYHPDRFFWDIIISRPSAVLLFYKGSHSTRFHYSLKHGCNLCSVRTLGYVQSSVRRQSSACVCVSDCRWIWRGSVGSVCASTTSVLSTLITVSRTNCKSVQTYKQESIEGWQKPWRHRYQSKHECIDDTTLDCSCVLLKRRCRSRINIRYPVVIVASQQAPV